MFGAAEPTISPSTPVAGAGEVLGVKTDAPLARVLRVDGIAGELRSWTGLLA